MRRSKKRRFWLRLKEIFSFLALILFLGILFWGFKESKIKKVNCLINGVDCPRSLKEEFDYFLGQNFFLIKKKAHEEAKHPDWKRVRIKRIFPGQVRVEIKTRQPTVSLLTKKSRFLVDQEGFVIEKTLVNPGLPEMEIKATDLAVGEKIQERGIQTALRLMELLEKNLISFQRGKLTEDKIIIELAEGREAWFPLEDNLEVKVASLQMIVNRVKIGENPPQRIDLRFKKPVIKD